MTDPWVCNATSIVGKEPDQVEAVQDVEQFQLDIFGLTVTHSASSGTKLLVTG